jgi:hypothetical protein
MTKAQVGCYAGGTTPRQSGPGPCMSGLDVTEKSAPAQLPSSSSELVLKVVSVVARTSTIAGSRRFVAGTSWPVTL